MTFSNTTDQVDSLCVHRRLRSLLKTGSTYALLVRFSAAPTAAAHGESKHAGVFGKSEDQSPGELELPHARAFCSDASGIILESSGSVLFL